MLQCKIILNFFSRSEDETQLVSKPIRTGCYQGGIGQQSRAGKIQEKDDEIE